MHVFVYRLIGRLHHLCTNLGRLPVSRRRLSCLQPPGNRLGHGKQSKKSAACHRCDEHGCHAQRKPDSVIHHSDQGSQYTSVAFGLRCKEMGVRPSMGSVGDCHDDAMCESFFATLECEVLDRRTFTTKAEARVACFEFIEGWYNPARRHSALGYKSLINYARTATDGLDSLSP